ncbi:DUF1566 domain-containing protein [bacterium]|nr:DUF1566 domain-containing protein [bacterium]
MKKFLISSLFILSVIFIISCVSDDDDKDLIDTGLSGDSQNDETADTDSPADTQTDSDATDPDKTDTASESGDEDKTDTAPEDDDSGKTDTDPELNDEENTDATSENDDTDSADPTEEPTDADTSDSTDDSDNSTDDSDPETGLTDLADWSASSPDKTDWNGAYNYCSAMTEDGHNWRLPTISELRQLVQNCAGTEYNGACGVKDGHLKESDYTYNECAKCTNRYDGGYSKLGDKDYLWSSSELDGNPSKVWVINFKSANIGTLEKATAEYGYARCVKE